MSLNRPVSFAAILLALPLLAHAQSPAAPGQQPPTSTPTLQVYSRETDVDVVVTDSHGNPVYGLKPSDFTIDEDGKPQTITNFSESSAPAAAAGYSLAAPNHVLPPGIYTNYQATPATGPVNIILLDALNGGPMLVDYAEQQVNHYFHTMPAGTQVAVFWLSASGLHMLQGFTSDRSLLEKATVTDRVDFGIYDIEWTRRWYTIDALNQIAAYVSGIKGRKNLLWFTPEPIFLLHDGGYAWMKPPDPGMVNRLMDTYELYIDEQIAVCPIDPHGVHEMRRDQLIMAAVAADTGGFAYFNNNDLSQGVAQAIQDGSHFYMLTYLPQHSDDRHFHTIKVTVDRPRLKLVYRPGYVAEKVPSPNLAGQSLMDASLAGKAPDATQILFDVRVLPATAPKAALQSVANRQNAKAPATSTPYDVLFAVPQQQISFTIGPDGKHLAKLQFGVTAYDIDGKRMDHFVYNVSLNLDDRQYANFMAKPLEFHRRFSLPAGQYSVHAGLLDQNSGRVGTIEVPVFNWQSQKQFNNAAMYVLRHRAQN